MPPISNGKTIGIHDIEAYPTRVSVLVCSIFLALNPFINSVAFVEAHEIQNKLPKETP